MAAAFRILGPALADPLDLVMYGSDKPEWRSALAESNATTPLPGTRFASGIYLGSDDETEQERAKTLAFLNHLVISQKTYRVAPADPERSPRRCSSSQPRRDAGPSLIYASPILT
jgi:hypothetical protein